jgi:P-type E1-E2 ATPase
VLLYIPLISIYDPIVTVAPLAFTIFTGMLTEAVADYKRYKQDRKTNAMTCRRVTNLKLKDTEIIRFDQVKVGDVLELREGEPVPADCLLLATQNASGECYVETRSLDGETNLKPKLAIK